MEHTMRNDCEKARFAEEIKAEAQTHLQPFGLNQLMEAVGARKDWETFKSAFSYLIASGKLHIAGRDDESQELMLSYWQHQKLPQFAGFYTDGSNPWLVPVISERVFTALIINARQPNDTVTTIAERLPQKFPELGFLELERIIVEIVAPTLLKALPDTMYAL
jgi:hypothetical protein